MALQYRFLSGTVLSDTKYEVQMSKRSKSRKQSSLSARRDVVNTPITNPRLLGGIQIRTQSQQLLDLARIFGQDDRAYSPHTIRPARTVTGRIASTTIQKKRPLRKARFQFSTPRTVTVCVRRRVRKEVMHATGSAGRRHFRKPRRNYNSNIRC